MMIALYAAAMAAVWLASLLVLAWVLLIRL